MTLFEPPLPEIPGHFREAVYKIAPPWLRNNWGVRFLYSLGIQLDGVAEYFRIGQLQRFPDYCVEEALAHLGKDRRISRGPNEPAAAYRARLKGWLTAWKYAGHPKAVLGQLAAYYSPSPPVLRYVANAIDENGQPFADWWTLDSGVYSHWRASPCNWNWDGTFGDYRFWIILYVPLLPRWSWGDPGIDWGDPGLLWGGYRNGQAVADLRNIVGTWKCAGTRCDQIIFASDETQLYRTWGSYLWGDGVWGQSTNIPMFNPLYPSATPPMPDGTWGDPDARDPNAQYFPGV